jgi:hypothetical protein
MTRIRFLFPLLLAFATGCQGSSTSSSGTEETPRDGKKLEGPVVGQRVEAPNLGLTGEVSGKITLDGQPVQVVSIHFHSLDGLLEVNTAVFSDSTYMIPQLEVGIYAVTIESDAPKGEPNEPPAKSAAREGSKIPGRYGKPDTSGLKVEVKEGKQVFDFALTTR